MIQDGHVFSFGGSSVFLTNEDNKDALLFIHFIKRCMQINQVVRLNDLLGALVKIQVQDLHVVGIASLTGSDWFFPADEFESLKSR